MQVTWPTAGRSDPAMEELAGILSVVAMSMVKFAVAPLLSLQLGYSIPSTVVMTSVGGCLGVFVFFKSSGWFMERSERSRRLKALRRDQEGRPPARVFNRRNRTIVRVKRSQGLPGLALITPAIISIPIGTIIAAKYFRHHPRALPWLFGSVVLWSLLLSVVWSLI